MNTAAVEQKAPIQRLANSYLTQSHVAGNMCIANANRSDLIAAERFNRRWGSVIKMATDEEAFALQGIPEADRKYVSYRLEYPNIDDPKLSHGLYFILPVQARDLDKLQKMMLMAVLLQEKFETAIPFLPAQSTLTAIAR